MARVKRNPGQERPAPQEDDQPLQWLEELVADPRGLPPEQYDRYPTSTRYTGPA